MTMAATKGRGAWRWAVLALVLVALAWPGAGPLAGQAEAGGPAVVRVYYTDQADLDALAARLDVWHVDPEAGFLTALVSDDEFRALREAGYRIEIDQARTQNVLVPPGYPCYKTVEELYADLVQVATDFPALTELIDIGDSWEKITPAGDPGYDLWVMKITNEAIPGDKPVAFLDASMHAREMVPAELALEFIHTLVEGYGLDPDITWLVNHREIHVLSMYNPDGRKKNEPSPTYWRKNTDNDDGCPYEQPWWNYYGTDLNRNHDFKWGCCGGSSGDPCDDTYRGPSAASEPETYFYEGYVRSIIPDQWDYVEPSPPPAPITSTGILLNMHSYGGDILYPWGWTSGPAPNKPQLLAIASKYGSLSGYTPLQQLYTVDGSTRDWGYADLGIPSFTLEMGTDFYEPCDNVPGIFADNIPAMLYLAKIARTPYLTVFGPDAYSLAVVPDTVPAGTPVALAATLGDQFNGGQTIQAAEYFIDQPGDEGTGLPMSPSDGAWNEVVEPAEAIVDTTGLAPGQHVILVHGQDAQGYWGPFTGVFLNVEAGTGLMHIDAIRLEGYMLPGPAYRVKAKIRIQDADALPVEGARVIAELQTPNQVRVRSAFTGPDGIATFWMRSRLGGVWIATVRNVKLEGWTYDRDADQEFRDGIVYP
jgi:carboxypeptidase T